MSASAPAHPTAGARHLGALGALNFFVADLQAGVGPFLGAYLLTHGWQSGRIGTVMTLGGVAGVLVTAPAGARIDATSHKRAYVVLPGLFSLVASAVVLMSQRFAWVTASQLAMGIAGALVGPAVNGITLGLVHQAGFPRQIGRNQAFNHAGNLAGAALSGLLGARFGFAAVFALAAAFGVLAALSALAIPGDAIDDAAARGLDADTDARVDGLGVLLRSRPLVVLAVALACFHLGNGAMLPLYGLATVAAHEGSPAGLVAMTIVVAQAVMVVVSLLATRVAQARGYWALLLVSFLALPVRGFVASQVITHAGIYPVQILDGVGAGLQSVAVPGLVARLLRGTGRVNVGQGAVMTVQGLGAATSPVLGGWLAQYLGYRVTFAILGSLALPSIALWLAFHRVLRDRDRADARETSAV